VPKNAIEKAFPKLAGTQWQISSNQDPKYNCIAFAAGKTNKPWWPDPRFQSHWPGTKRSAEIDNFVSVFQSELGYERCIDGTLEDGYEKICLYEKSSKGTHMARQLGSGSWTSKLGPEEDIIHEVPEHLENEQYGKASIFLRRKIVK
jgi:hypothetical protein